MNPSTEPAITTVFAVAGLLTLTSLALPAARALRLPYTVFLAALGLALGFLSLSPFPMTGALGDFLASLSGVRLSAEGLLYLFLPGLLFAAGLTIDARKLFDDLAPVLLLAIVAVIVCTAVAGLALQLLTGNAILACLLLAAIVATTDSAAVVAVLREIGAPRRLVILLEGESLFNDAAAIALFALIISLMTGAGETLPLGIVADMAWSIGGGFALGYASARLAGLLCAQMRDALAAEITLTIALAYLTYVVGETYFGVSGVIAVVTAAMVFSASGRLQVSRGAWPNIVGVWRMIEFWATSLVFTLAAMYVPMAIGTFTFEDVAIIAALFAATLVARILVLFGLMPALSTLRIAAPVENSHKAIIVWGGLRGAVTIALALSVNETAALPEEVRRFILVGATGFVLTTLFLNATTLRPLLRLFGLDRLTAEERRLREVARANAEAAVHRRLNLLGQSFASLEGLVETAAAARPSTLAAAGVSGREELSAGLLALAARERQIYFEYYQQGIIGRLMAESLRLGAARLEDAVRAGGAEGYESALWQTYRSGWRLQLCLWLQRRLSVTGPLSAFIALRLENLLAMDLASRDLVEFLQAHLAPLVSEETSAALLKVVETRAEAIRGAIDILDIQYTNYLEGLKARHKARTALHLEGLEYQRLRRLMLISADVHEDLEEERRRRLRQFDARPALDIGERIRLVMRRVPLFQGLADEEMRRIACLFKPRLYPPGATVIEKGAIGESLFIIAAGRLHVELDDRSVPLSPGDFVGEMALINRQPRSRMVIARGFAYLLELEAADLKRLLRRHPALKAEIERMAEQRLAAAAPDDSEAAHLGRDAA